MSVHNGNIVLDYTISTIPVTPRWTKRQFGRKLPASTADGCRHS